MGFPIITYRSYVLKCNYCGLYYERCYIEQCEMCYYYFCNHCDRVEWNGKHELTMCITCSIKPELLI